MFSRVERVTHIDPDGARTALAAQKERGPPRASCWPRWSRTC